MNLMLLSSADFTAPDRVCITDRRLHHVNNVLRSQLGDQLRVGLVNHRWGLGTIIKLNSEQLEMEIVLDRQPPVPLAIKLVVALPRPPSLRKIIQQATSMGVKQFIFIQSSRVEKSYWTSSALQENDVKNQMLLGLEQAGDTLMPQIELHRQFKPFIHERWPELIQQTTPILADPNPTPSMVTKASSAAFTLVVGPEGGFIPYELDTFRQLGCVGISLGERILRVETAVVALIARLSVFL